MPKRYSIPENEKVYTPIVDTTGIKGQITEATPTSSDYIPLGTSITQICQLTETLTGQTTDTGFKQNLYDGDLTVARVYSRTTPGTMTWSLLFALPTFLIVPMLSSLSYAIKLTTTGAATDLTLLCETSMDNVHWSTLKSVTFAPAGPQDSYQSEMFANISCKYVRISGTVVNSGADSGTVTIPWIFLVK